MLWEKAFWWSLEEVQELTFANMAGIYDDEKQESRFCLNEDGTATWCMIGSLNYTEYTYTINGNTICLKPKGVESEDDCYDYDEDTRTLKNEQGTIYYRQIVELWPAWSPKAKICQNAANTRRLRKEYCE